MPEMLCQGCHTCATKYTYNTTASAKFECNCHHSCYHNCSCSSSLASNPSSKAQKALEPPMRIELTTCSLQNCCSARLSYGGIVKCNSKSNTANCLNKLEKGRKENNSYILPPCTGHIPWDFHLAILPNTITRNPTKYHGKTPIAVCTFNTSLLA